MRATKRRAQNCIKVIKESLSFVAFLSVYGALVHNSIDEALLTSVAGLQMEEAGVRITLPQVSNA
jgi:hypothetical protein